MKHPDSVRTWLARRHAGWHRDWLGAEPQRHWPLTIALGLPTEAEALRQPDAVRAWAASWRAWRGEGELRWVERRWRVLGVQTLPEALVLHGPEQATAWIGERERWRRAAARFAATTARWPALARALARHYDVLADYADSDFQRLLDLLAWLRAHPASGLYPRQIPLAGMDSKWLEPRKGVVADLVAAAAADGNGGGDAEGDGGGFASGKDFHQLCGLKRAPSLVRMRVLDPALRAVVGGVGDISAPVEALAAISWQPAKVVIVENLQTGLALEDMPGTVAFMALGYAVDALGAVPWIDRAACLYWGDIDTHGYAILHQARCRFPHLVSVMMDEATMLRFAALWTEERSQHSAQDFAGLTPAERAVYAALRNNTWGQRLRLEQERIAWDVAWPALSGGAA
nr:Wadjet anti-phage system protein JetD domain-containing protein [uncultured Duganella sp.]